MVESLEKIYQQIGQAVADALPEPWNTAWVRVDLKPGVISIQGRYVSQSENNEKSFLVPRQVRSSFVQLHNLMRDSMKADWQQAVFEMKSDGKFDFSFVYDNPEVK